VPRADLNEVILYGAFLQFYGVKRFGYSVTPSVQNNHFYCDNLRLQNCFGGQLNSHFEAKRNNIMLCFICDYDYL